MFLLRSSAILLALVWLPACATLPSSGQQIVLVSKDYRFINEIYNESAGKSRDIDAWLRLPDSDSYAPPYPAVVFLHSSWGLSKQEWHYAELFAELGVVSLIIDSFKPRGIRRTSMDQSLVSTASMLADAFSALDYLANEPRIRRDRIAIMGFSKGAIATLYSSITRVQQVMTIHGDRFAAHLAFYPWCGVLLKNMRTTGVPIAIHGGSRDVVTPIEQCENFVRYQLQDEDKSHIQIVRYENARHAFDHPALQKIPFVVPMNVQVPGNCLFVEERKGIFVEKSTRRHVNGDNFSQVLSLCSHHHGAAGRNRDAAMLAGENAKLFIQETLLP